MFLRLVITQKIPHLSIYIKGLESDEQIKQASKNLSIQLINNLSIISRENIFVYLI
jgi:hypothetical protein